MLLGFSLLLLLAFTRSSDETNINSLSHFWVAFFVAASSLFYRSFQSENQNKNFILFTQFSVPRIFIFLSQAFVQTARLFLIGIFYLFALYFLFQFEIKDFSKWLLILLEVSLVIAPLGTLLGLGLQVEREFLFSLIFLPLITPVVLGAYAQSMGEQPQVWASLIGAFGSISWFVGSLIFEFFFDDLTQNS